MNKTHEQAIKEIQQGKAAPLYILIGEEEWARNKFLAAVKKALVDPGMEDFNYDAYNATDVTGFEVVDKAGMLPMMADRRLVVVTGCHLWKKKDSDNVTKYLDQINEKACLVMQFDEADKRRRLFSAKSPQVRYLEFPRPKPWELNDYIAELAADMKIKLNAEACALVAELAGDDLARVYRELDKLSLFKMGQEIQAEDVEALMGRTRLATRWELGEFIGTRDLHGALLKMHHIMDSGFDPPSMLGAVNSYVKQLYMTKAHMIKGVREARQLAGLLAVPNKVAEALMEHQKNYSNLELRLAFQAMRETDIRIKSSAMSRDLILDQLLIAVVSRGPYSPPPPKAKR